MVDLVPSSPPRPNLVPDEVKTDLVPSSHLVYRDEVTNGRTTRGEQPTSSLVPLLRSSTPRRGRTTKTFLAREHVQWPRRSTLTDGMARLSQTGAIAHMQWSTSRWSK